MELMDLLLLSVSLAFLFSSFVVLFPAFIKFLLSMVDRYIMRMRIGHVHEPQIIGYKLLP